MVLWTRGACVCVCVWGGGRAGTAAGGLGRAPGRLGEQRRGAARRGAAHAGRGPGGSLVFGAAVLAGGAPAVAGDEQVVEDGGHLPHVRVHVCVGDIERGRDGEGEERRESEIE
jgi:hypothetical protein